MHNVWYYIKMNILLLSTNVKLENQAPGWKHSWLNQTRRNKYRFVFAHTIRNNMQIQTI